MNKGLKLGVNSLCDKDLFGLSFGVHFEKLCTSKYIYYSLQIHLFTKEFFVLYTK